MDRKTPLLASALLVALIGSQGCTNKDYEVDFKELITNSGGIAQTTDSQTGENREFHVQRDDGSPIEGAIVDYIDANHFEFAIISYDDGARDGNITPVSIILPGGDDQEDISVVLSETGFLWEDYQQTGSTDRRNRYEAAHDVTNWAATSPDVFGYRGCRTFESIQSDNRNVGVFLYDVAKAALPYVSLISTSAQSGQEMINMANEMGNGLPSIFSDPEECEAFQTFIFGPDYEGEFANTWTPTFSIMANLCVETIPDDEIANNGIDDNCDGFIDENGSIGDDDDGDDDDDDTGLEDYLLFDDFTGDSISTSNWPSSGWFGDDPIVSNSNLVYDGNISRSGVSSSYQDYTGDRLVLETEIEASDHFQIEMHYGNGSNESIIIGNFLNFDIENAFWVWCSNAVLYDGSPLSTTSTSRIRLEHRRSGDLEVQVNGSSLNLAFACETATSNSVKVNIEQREEASYDLEVDYLLLREE